MEGGNIYFSLSLSFSLRERTVTENVAHALLSFSSLLARGCKLIGY